MDGTRPAYKYHVLAVLLCGYALNSFDRSILSLLLEPIGREFGASDTQLGLLSDHIERIISLFRLPVQLPSNDLRPRHRGG